MVSTRRKKLSKRKLLSQLHDLDQGIIIVNTAGDRQQSATVNESTGDQEFTIGYPGSNLTANENVANVKTFERCCNERIDREMDNFVDTVKDKIENSILTAIDSIYAPKMELAVRSIHVFSGRVATNVTVNSDHGKHSGIAAPLETYPK